jgi:PAS domain S-box-containing protein
MQVPWSSAQIPDFQTLFQSAPGLYVVLTPDFKIVAATDAYLRATMTNREDIVGRGIFDVFPDNPDEPQPGSSSSVRASLERVLKWKVADTMPSQRYDIAKPESEGGGFEERYWIPINWPVLDANNNVIFLIISAEQVTESVLLRRQGIGPQAVASELQNEERFRKAFNAYPEPITIATVSDGRYVDVNESFCHVTGFRREEVIGRTSSEMHFWSNAEDRVRMIEAVLEHGSVRDLEAGFRTKSGEQRSGIGSAELLEVAGQQLIIVIFKDVTDQKSLEKQLLQAQKMEAIGLFSAGIAHDFNNLLSVIIGYSEMIEEDLAQNEPLQKKCHEVTKAGHRAAALIRQLLAFSRQQILEPKVMSLNAVIVDSEKMFRVLLGEGVQYSSLLDASLGTIKADQGQIEQVIMNLIVNARDAMPKGGKLCIETSNFAVDENYVRLHSQQQLGRFVALSVSDTGIGMNAETQSRIFDPFFTTKEVGKGTGLGLSTVYGVVKQSGGHIGVYSEVGIGTTFTIYLPRVEEPIRPDKIRADLDHTLGGNETILLVDDEESLRELISGLLRQSGYTVIVAATPDQALEIAAHDTQRVHLLLTDVVMPGMNGHEMAQKMASIRPDMKVIYMSGYAGFTHRGVLEAEAIFLPKPITRGTLLRKVREVLFAESAATPE